MEIEKNYDPKKVEMGKAEFWEKNHYHEGNLPQNKKKKPFSMIIPPPNVTGILHIGHAKNTITTDVIARYKRLNNFDVLFVPATDHAGIATQARVEAELRKENISKYDLGREKFLERVWQWKYDYASYFHKQWAALGISMDMTKERFTLDDDMNEAVNIVFKKLYDEKLIYRGERIINWDPVLQTALSNIEVEHKEIEGKFYYFKYRFASDPSKYLEIATTRPETMFGDTALVCNPKDERYVSLIGEKFINPANNEVIPLIADRYVDISFGTGVMKCTPAHDPNDFEIGKRHKLEVRKIMNLDGTMNELCGEFATLDRFVCREKLVEKIKNEDNLIKIENIKHQVGHSERSKEICEPMLSKQWFIKMKPLVEDLLNIQKSKDAIKFLPKRFAKIFKQWLENTEDWCISRQLWWGHRIPVYTNKETGEVVCSVKKLDENLYSQDEDVLDTWFSSALAPFAFLGWPQTDELTKRFYPLDVMVTAYDILFFWVARMAFDGVHFMKQIPFKKVFLHGLIRDEQGRKMSKSLGNGIDPFEVINVYGADALRYSISTSGTPGLDIPFGNSSVEFGQQYLTKIWNVSRFLLTSLPEDFDYNKVKKSSKDMSIIEHYLFNNLNKTIKDVKRFMNNFELGMASNTLYNFVYDVFCSQYVELVKNDLRNGSQERKNVIFYSLIEVIRSILILLFPFVPFITEEIYSYLPNHKNSIYEEKYPTTYRNIDSSKAEDGQAIVDIIKYVRNFKMTNKLGISSKIDIEICCGQDNDYISNILKSIVFANNVTYVEMKNELVKFRNYGIKICVDDKLYSESIAKRIEFLKSEIERSKKMLSNENFVNRAKPNIVQKEREKLESYEKELNSYKN